MMSDPVRRKPPRYIYEIPDRHGNARLYFWRGRGHPRIRIREEPGSLAFYARYEELLREPRTAQRGPQERTWRRLCALYYASPEFRRLETSTQSVRRRTLDSTCAEPLEPGSAIVFGECPLDRMGSKQIRVLRDRKADTPHAANNRLKAIRYVFAWAAEAEHVKANPGRDVAPIKAPSDGHHSWSIAEVDQFEARHPVGSMARLALDLLIFTGVRRSDVVRLGQQHVRNGWLRFTTAKTHVSVEIPILPALQATIDASATGDLAFLVTELGQPFTAAGFGNKMRAWCNEAGLPECSAHGLRKASATRAAENGATASQLMAMYGWLNMREAERYTKTAQRSKLAGAATVLLRRPEAKKGT